MERARPKLRVGVLGAGFFVGYHLRAWRRLDEIALVGLCSRTFAKAEAVARAHGIEHVFSHPVPFLERLRLDLVDIVTPPETHRALIELATKHGVAAICQKPFCRSLDEARAATAVAERAGTTLIVHENFRFQPWHEEIRRLVNAGAIGEPYQATFRLRPGDGAGADAYLARQPYFREMERFLIRETGVHLIDTLRALLGEVRAVQARLRRLNPVIRGEDAGVVLMEFEAGAWGLLDSNRLVDHATDEPRRTLGELVVEGSEATLSLDGTGRISRRRRGELCAEPHIYPWDDREFGGDCAYRLQNAAARHLLHGEPMPNFARAFLRNLEVEEAIYRAHAEGRRIDLGAGDG